MTPTVIGVLTIAFVLACCASDVRRRRIPNFLTGAAALVGIFLNLWLFGLRGLVLSVSGLLGLTALLLAPFALGGIGAGDVKMMGAVGALLGPVAGVFALVAGMIVGGAIMLVHLARLGRLRERLEATWSRLAAAILTRSLAPLRVSAAAPDAISLPYSVPLGIGVIVVILLSCSLTAKPC